jgi:hypothetical protein
VPRVIDREAAKRAIKEDAAAKDAKKKLSPPTPGPPRVVQRPGRPTKYQQGCGEQARRLHLLGHTDAEVAAFFSISTTTLENWDKVHPEFRETRMQGKLPADANVAASLYERTRGYSHPAVKIFLPAGATKPVYAQYVEHYPPDAQAAEFWLRNRQADRWKTKWETTNTNVNLDIVMDPEARRRRIEELSRKLAPLLEGKAEDPG